MEKLIDIFEKFGIAEGIPVIIFLVIAWVIFKSEIRFNFSLKKKETK